MSNIPVASVVNDGGAGSGRSWQSQRASVIGDGRTGRSPATSPARTRDAPISGSPLRELRGYAATETARRGSRRGRGTGSAPNTPEVKTGALPDETARWKSSLRAEIRGENGRPRDSAMRRQPRADHVADGREAAIDALIAEHEDALRTMKEEMDDERAEMIRSAERIRAEASEGVAEAAAQWLEERKFLNLRVDELETALRAAAEEAEAKRIEADEKFELEKAELRARLESAVEEAAGKEAKMTERFTIEKGVVEEQMGSTRREAAREVAAARDAQAREHERCKAEVERMTARMDEMREAHASELREATEHLEIGFDKAKKTPREGSNNRRRRGSESASRWSPRRRPRAWCSRLSWTPPRRTCQPTANTSRGNSSSSGRNPTRIGRKRGRLERSPPRPSPSARRPWRPRRLGEKRRISRVPSRSPRGWTPRPRSRRSEPRLTRSSAR